ncbi:MAG TPA: glutathione S-transferase N-terminal domain-containing protein [Polyangiaceae bacterium]|jgi:glutathione S-transferase
MTLALYGMAYSPYSEKARWALDHHRVAYEWHEHVPMIGERRLRKVAGANGGKVSVPLAVDDGTVLRESLSIAKHAERVGKGARLFANEAAVTTWAARSDEALDAGRALLLQRLLADRDALRESLPSWVPGALRGLSTPIAARGTRYLVRKYGTAGVDSAAATAKLRDVFGAMRKVLGSRSTILDGFSYADIAMAVLIQMISPVAPEYVALGPARRRAWTEPELSSEYADLVAWRDALYAKRRR